jgi:predicted pyridoxine 5'-phosphate oxidase superfamily flavin-nucleotide-binding protein
MCSTAAAAPGFLKVVDPKTLPFTDIPGNRQFISVGNLAHNDCVALILVDHAHWQRLKILGQLSVRETVGEGRPQREMTIRFKGAPDGRVADGSCNGLPCSATDR